MCYKPLSSNINKKIAIKNVEISVCTVQIQGGDAL